MFVEDQGITDVKRSLITANSKSLTPSSYK